MNVTQSENSKPEASGLCSVCSSTLFSNHSFEKHAGPGKRAGASGSFHPSLQSLQASREALCAVCCQLRDDPHEGWSGSSTFNIVSEAHDRFYVEIDWKLQSGKSNTHTRQRLYLKPASSTLKSQRILATASLQEESTFGAGVFRLVSHWLKQCLENHPACAKNVSPSQYPTRLLDIAESVVRLLDTRTTSLNAPYATLSHRWGDLPFLVLSRDNMAAFESGIEISKLPKTFQDIMTAAQNLGIRFLWIDSCCIIQSGKGAMEDKAREIAQMSEVYSHSLINFAASAASGPHHGVVREREAKQLSSTYVNWSPHRGSATRLYYISFISKPDEIFEKLRKGSPLMRRAWVVQERLLAPRMLHFGRDQVHWECTELRGACEMFPEGGYVRGGDSQGTRTVDVRAPFVLTENDRSHRAVLRHWGLAITNFTALGISKPSEDKLAAIGAVAKRLEDILDDQYMAGMFRRDLMTQLCWQVEEPGKRPSQWRAPSWSWASVDCFVESFISSLTGAEFDLATLVAYHVEPTAGGSRYGGISSAWIKVQARLLKATSMMRAGSSANNYVRIGHIEEQAWFDDDSSKDNLHFMPTSLTQSVDRGSSKLGQGYGLWIQGLILQQLGPRIHRRLGTVNTPFSLKVFKCLLDPEPEIVLLI